MRALVCLLLALALAAGCRTTRMARPLTLQTPPEAIRLEAQRAWGVLEDGRRLGTVIEFRPITRVRDPIFSVLDPAGLEMGLVDALGRVWQGPAEGGERLWLGSGTLLEGARRLLGGGEGAVLVAEALPAGG